MGRDSRISGEALAFSCIKGLNRVGGIEVYYFDLCSTPAMFMSTVNEETNVDGAIMITASHLPFNRNGLKFFTKDGGLEGKDIHELLEIASGLKTDSNINPQYKSLDFLSIYAEELRNIIIDKTGCENPFEGLKIIVDAGNGVGGFFADKVLKKLGADTAGSVFLEPDGMFPNHIPNPEKKDVMDGFCKVVKENNADMGIIFDTDVDRAALVDKGGIEINRNRLVALMSSIVLKEAPNSYIVTDSVTSKGLNDYISNLGGVHHRFKRGYKNVINEGIRLNDENKECLLAIETSGHCALKENYFLDDGAYMIVKVLIEACSLLKEGKTLSYLIETLAEPKEAEEIRGKFLVEDFKPYGQKVLEDFKTFVKSNAGWSLEIPNYEGVRVNCDENNGNGWVLLRLSLHDPQMPINIESDSIGGVEIMKKKVLDFLSDYKIEF